MILSETLACYAAADGKTEYHLVQEVLKLVRSPPPGSGEDAGCRMNTMNPCVYLGLVVYVLCIFMYT